MPDETTSTLRRQAWLYGPAGLRAGWRLLIFGAVLVPILVTRKWALRKLTNDLDDDTPYILGQQASRILALLAAGWVMSKIERRNLGDYGLPAREMFRGLFWKGLALGFMSLTVILVLMKFTGAFAFGPVKLQGTELAYYALLNGLIFLLMGLSEEYFYRGYAQFTLATGIGFWPAAACGTAVFIYHHTGNKGETWLGLVNVGLIALLFCFMLLRTGNLWLPVGFHTSWNWGLSYFYGVPTSGLEFKGQLMDSSVSGPHWLGGGSAGPEGSIVCSLAVVGMLIMVAKWFPETRSPDFPHPAKAA